MHLHESRLNTVDLWKSIYHGWNPGWIKDGSGVLMSNGQSVFSPDMFHLARLAVEEIEDSTGLKAKYLLAVRLPAGVVVPVHTDTLVQNSVARWHLPLITNKDAWFWEEDIGFRHLPAGAWAEVNYHKRHTIGNFGRTERVHLIVDLW